MTQTIKNILGGAAALAVLAVAYASLSYVNAYSKVIEPSSFRSFSVTGEGKITAVPDIATFNFQVITEGDKDVTTLQTKNTNDTNKVIAFIKDQGVAEKDIKTQYYDVTPRYENYRCVTPMASSDGMIKAEVCPPPAIVGYTVSQSVSVKIRDFSKIGDIMGGVVTNGANQVGSLSFTIDDSDMAHDQARAEAIAKATENAKSIAKEGNFRVGRLLGIQEGSNSPIYYKAMATMEMDSNGVGGGAATPSIQPGSQEVTVTVTMQYEIQ